MAKSYKKVYIKLTKAKADKSPLVWELISGNNVKKFNTQKEAIEFYKKNFEYSSALIYDENGKFNSSIKINEKNNIDYSTEGNETKVLKNVDIQKNKITKKWKILTISISIFLFALLITGILLIFI